MEGEIMYSDYPIPDFPTAVDYLGQAVRVLGECRRTLEWVHGGTTNDPELDTLIGSLVRSSMDVEKVRRNLMERYYSPVGEIQVDEYDGPNVEVAGSNPVTDTNENETAEVEDAVTE